MKRLTNDEVKKVANFVNSGKDIKEAFKKLKNPSATIGVVVDNAGKIFDAYFHPSFAKNEHPGTVSAMNVSINEFCKGNLKDTNGNYVNCDEVKKYLTNQFIHYKLSKN